MVSSTRYGRVQNGLLLFCSAGSFPLVCFSGSGTSWPKKWVPVKTADIENVKVVVGIPLDVYNYIGIKRIRTIEKDTGLDSIVPVDESRKDFLERFRKKKEKVVGVFLGMDVLEEYLLYEDVKKTGNIRTLRGKKSTGKGNIYGRHRKSEKRYVPYGVQSYERGNRSDGSRKSVDGS
jgi:hypothetical protein